MAGPLREKQMHALLLLCKSFMKRSSRGGILYNDNDDNDNNNVNNINNRDYSNTNDITDVQVLHEALLAGRRPCSVAMHDVRSGETCTWQFLLCW